jgi:hypothetical protein
MAIKYIGGNNNKQSSIQVAHYNWVSNNILTVAECNNWKKKEEYPQMKQHLDKGNGSLVKIYEQQK